MYSECLNSCVMAQAIRAHERRFPELDQVQMQRAVCAFISAGAHPSGHDHMYCTQLLRTPKLRIEHAAAF